MPNLLSGSEKLIPAVFAGTIIIDLLTCGLSSEVLASKQKKSACSELVIHILLPLMM